METMNSRIYALRKALKLNQTAFGERIGLKQNTVSQIETLDYSVSDRNISIICDAFSVSEQWLRTGEGEMFATPDGKDVYDLLREQFQMTPTEERVLRAYFAADERERAAIIAFMERTAKEIADRKAAPVEEYTPEELAAYEKVRAIKEARDAFVKKESPSSAPEASDAG